jgi:hypothetical protein
LATVARSRGCQARCCANAGFKHALDLQVCNGCGSLWLVRVSGARCHLIYPIRTQVKSCPGKQRRELMDCSQQSACILSLQACADLSNSGSVKSQDDSTGRSFRCVPTETAARSFDHISYLDIQSLNRFPINVCNKELLATCLKRRRVLNIASPLGMHGQLRGFW